jgi:hypothetical protein
MAAFKQREWCSFLGEMGLSKVRSACHMLLIQPSHDNASRSSLRQGDVVCKKHYTNNRSALHP